MADLLRWVCLESVREEIEDDEETIEYIEGLIKEFAKDFDGFGVYLEPQETPDRVLWIPAEGTPTVMWFDDDAFERREAFESYVVGLFRDDWLS